MEKVVNIKKTIISNSIFILLVLTVGRAYVYFNAQIIGDETVITADSGTMIIKYDGGPDIVVGSINPSDLPFATKTFTVTGNSKAVEPMDYNVSIIMSENTFSDYGLSYKLTGDNTGLNGNIIPSSSNNMCYFMTGATEVVLGNGNFIGPTNGDKIILII